MNAVITLTVAVCSYNRAARLPVLVPALMAQTCPAPFEVLVINNNSSDDTQEVLEQLHREYGKRLRYVLEPNQGIVHARNRAIAEALDRDYLVFIDDDELPRDGFLLAAMREFDSHETARCVGGKIVVDFEQQPRPAWLGNDLLGFLGQNDNGDSSLWVKDHSTPLWSGNIAYAMAVFREHPDLRFDIRYDRQGKNVGGGEDVLMFQEFLSRGLPMRYCPDMVVDHLVEPWRLCRRYFLRLHYSFGFKAGLLHTDSCPRTFLGIPRFLFRHLLRDMGRVVALMLRRRQGILRQAMTAAHTWGMIRGYYHSYNLAACQGTSTPR